MPTLIFVSAVSLNEFNFYASGRQNCYYSLFKMEMLHRQCLVSSLVIDRLQNLTDTLTVEIPIRFPNIDPSQPSPVPLEFFVCKQSKVQSAFSTHEHFKDFVSQIKADNLVGAQACKDRLVVLAESEEAANMLINKDVGEVLCQLGDSLIDVHITDRQVYNK